MVNRISFCPLMLACWPVEDVSPGGHERLVSMFALSPRARASLKWLQSQRKSSTVGEETWTESDPASSCRLSFRYSCRYSGGRLGSSYSLTETHRSLDYHGNYLPRSYHGGFFSEAGCTEKESLTSSVNKYLHILGSTTKSDIAV